MSQWRPRISLCHFGYRFPEDLQTQMQNTWRIQYSSGRARRRKWIAALISPLVRELWGTSRGDWRVLKTRENPEASGHESWDLTLTSSFRFLGHIFVVPSQVFPKILTEESRPSKRHWCTLRPAPLVSKLRYHHVYRNATQTQNLNSLLLPLPHAWQVATSGRGQGKLPQVHFKQVLLSEFSLWQRPGCKIMARNAGPRKIFF